MCQNRKEIDRIAAAACAIGVRFHQIPPDDMCSEIAGRLASALDTAKDGDKVRAKMLSKVGPIEVHIRKLGSRIRETQNDLSGYATAHNDLIDLLAPYLGRTAQVHYPSRVNYSKPSQRDRQAGIPGMLVTFRG